MDPHSEKMENKIDALLRPALLCAVGDGHLSEEELEDLGKIRADVRNFLLAREAIEFYRKTGDFEGSKKFYDGENTVMMHNFASFGFGSLFGGVAPHLVDLWETRAPMQTSEEMFALYKIEADKIKDPFEQRVAMITMRWVAASDDDFSHNERVVADFFEEHWGITDFSEFIQDACSVTKGEIIEHEDTEGLEGVLAALLDLLGSIEDPADSIRFDTKGNKNLLPQAVACITMCMAADGEIDDKELEELSSTLLRLKDFYDFEDLEALMAQVNETINDVLRQLDFEEGVSPQNVSKFAKKAAKNITDNTLASLICHFAIVVAGADGLDGEEEKVLEFYMNSWNVTDEDITQIAEELA